MGRWVKVPGWVAVFLACAGVGAYIAAHTDPFPPGVDRPGASSSPTATPSPSSSSGPVVWAGTLRSMTFHQLYVGGRCTTRWRGNLRFTVDDAGRFDGSGTAHLDGKLECDFPNEQTQIREFGLTVNGRLLEGGMALRLSQASIDPVNGRDFGAFGAFLPVRMLLPTEDGVVGIRIDRGRVDEQGRGHYTWSTMFRLRTVGG